MHSPHNRGAKAPAHRAGRSSRVRPPDASGVLVSCPTPLWTGEVGVICQSIQLLQAGQEKVRSILLLAPGGTELFLPFCADVRRQLPEEVPECLELTWNGGRAR